MFYKYLISNVSDKEVLYLFLDNRYEISSEFSKDIKEDYPIWEDRVKYLFRLNENNEVVRNDNLDPAYSMIVVVMVGI